MENNCMINDAGKGMLNEYGTERDKVIKKSSWNYSSIYIVDIWFCNIVVWDGDGIIFT